MICGAWPMCADQAEKDPSMPNFQKLQVILQDCETWIDQTGLESLPTLTFHVAGALGAQQELKLPPEAWVLDVLEEEVHYIRKHVMGVVPTRVPQVTGKKRKVCAPAFGEQEYNSSRNGPVSLGWSTIAQPSSPHGEGSSFVVSRPAGDPCPSVGNKSPSFLLTLVRVRSVGLVLARDGGCIDWSQAHPGNFKPHALVCIRCPQEPLLCMCMCVCVCAQSHYCSRPADHREGICSLCVAWSAYPQVRRRRLLYWSIVCHVVRKEHPAVPLRRGPIASRPPPYPTQRTPCRLASCPQRRRSESPLVGDVRGTYWGQSVDEAGGCASPPDPGCCEA